MHLLRLALGSLKKKVGQTIGITNNEGLLYTYAKRIFFSKCEYVNYVLRAFYINILLNILLSRYAYRQFAQSLHYVYTR